MGVNVVFRQLGENDLWSKHHNAGIVVHPVEASDGQGWRAQRNLAVFPLAPSTLVVIVGSLFPELQP